ncbi:hypothetical protein, partial [Polaribacter sp. Z022]|uniref:hypothetical protein n=1 Tax=Polaribacter sp. Z022 TaxID=2927125 RepID=UPI00202128B0
MKIFTLFSFMSASIFCQNGMLQLGKNDFEFESHYYKGNLIMKTKINEFIKDLKNEKLNLNEFLLGNCIPLNTEEKLTEKDSINKITVAQRSLGNTVLCIKK